jgi:RNA polymerase sigma-70 factor (ECF subfamily)
MDRDAFERCWQENVHRVAAYARRHVGSDASLDITSAAFLTAWRTWSRVPDPALPWLLSAARGHIRNHHRSIRRETGLRERLELLDQSAADGPDAAMLADERMNALYALASLSDDDREALLLVAWDGLTTDQAAKVVGCRPGAMRTRLHRARTRLQADLSATASGTNRRIR